MSYARMILAWLGLMFLANVAASLVAVTIVALTDPAADALLPTHLLLAIAFGIPLSLQSRLFRHGFSPDRPQD